MTETAAPNTFDRTTTSGAAGTSCSFLYEECDIRPEMTLSEYRSELDRARRPHRRTGRSLRRRSH
jgi:hypothetical protein